MWFRYVLALGAIFVLSATLWLSTHVSSDAVVFHRWSWSYASLLAVLLLIATTFGWLAGPGYLHIAPQRFNILVSIAATILSLGLIEFGVRFFDAFGISYYEQASQYHSDKIPDTDLYYRHRPNFHTVYSDVEVSTNAIGMRDRQINKKGVSEFRVLFVGDSVTFGAGVAEKDTFARRIESMLGAELGFPVRTLNGGVGGYNTTQELAFLSRYGPILSPDLVILMYVANDTDINSEPGERFDPLSAQRPTGKSPPEISRWWLGRSWTYRAVAHFQRILRSQASPATGLIGNTPGWKASASALLSIAQWRQERDVQFVTFLARMHREPLTDNLLSELSRIGEEHDIHIIDTLPWFETYRLRDVTISKVDAHPNSKGHEIYAEGITTLVHNLGFFRER